MKDRQTINTPQYGTNEPIHKLLTTFLHGSNIGLVHFIFNLRLY